MCAKKLVLRVLLVNTAIAFIPPMFVAALEPGITAHQLLACFGVSVVYAHCIGSLAYATLPKIWVTSERSRPWVRWPARGGAMFAATIIGCLIACLVFVALRWIPMRLYWAEFLGSLKIATLITVMAGTGLSMYESFHARLQETTLQLRSKELERERALKLATEAQLASLESRVHPHFLFNTLNSISSLIPEDPKRAERLVEQMASLLRFSLDAPHAGLVPLDREMKVVSDYVAIEQARYGDRLRFKIDAPSELGATQVPPLAIQSLVENSVKHAVSPSPTGGEIRVSIARNNGSLQVRVLDQGPEFTLDAAPSGHGLDILKGRLAALFGRQGSLSLERSGRCNQMTLLVPQDNNGHAGVSG